MKTLAGVCQVVATLAIVVMATGRGTGTTDAPQAKERKAVPLKVVVLIRAETKGVSEGAKIKQIDTLKEAAVAKKSLDQVQEKNGKEVKRLNGTYVVKDAKITLADGRVVVVECQVLVAVEPGKTGSPRASLIRLASALQSDPRPEGESVQSSTCQRLVAGLTEGHY